ncbi:MAG: hypothetical protein ACYS9X_09705, partial [Planctomycetota bacterium]
FIFVLFERRMPHERTFTSPVAHAADVGGVAVSAWPIGEKFMYRWRDGGLEFSLLGNVPPDVAWEFLVANVGEGHPLRGSASGLAEGAGERADERADERAEEARPN